MDLSRAFYIILYLYVYFMSGFVKLDDSDILGSKYHMYTLEYSLLIINPFYVRHFKFFFQLCQAPFNKICLNLCSVAGLRKRFSILFYECSPFHYYLPLEKDMALHLHKSPKDALCQVWLKLVL